MKSFKILVFLFLSVQAFTQDGTLILENMNCPSGGNTITFDLTFTESGIPANVSGSFFLNFFDAMNDNVFTYSETTNSVILDQIAVNSTLQSGYTCDGIIGTNITAVASQFDNGENDSVSFLSFPNTNVSTASSIPTLGEWGLIILGLLIMTIGIVSVRKSSKVLS